jgi:hypothetical protein
MMKKKRKAPPAVEEIEFGRLAEILERARSAPLSEPDHRLLSLAVSTLTYLTEEVRAKNASLARIKRILFGARTEKTETVLRAKKGAGGEEKGKTESGAESPPAGDPKKKRKGHGRNGAAAYAGATTVQTKHPTIEPGAPCPEACGGKVYPLKEPAVLLRVKAMAPVNAVLHALERLRCNLCGKVFTAPAPPGVGEKKYDESVGAMVGLVRYGGGMPFTRIETLQRLLGVPLPAGTQWGLVEEAANAAEPAFEELVRVAAQGDVIHNDDTAMKILEIDPEAWAEEQEEELSRTGTFTSGVISRIGERAIALFFTGRHHAGENLAKVLSKREAALSEPIQMCDALSRNTPGELKTILANCMAHARRRFVEVVETFPEECERVLDTLRDVYRTDEIARDRAMTPVERLALHRAESGPRMERLGGWLREQLEERRVEPNSILGEAIGYMRKHWENLTLFLREPGAPLDNNVCERALKKAILHRKNSLFYKTENGARVGDIFMSLVHTCEIGGENPFEYLVALQRNAPAVRAAPADWLPWTFRETLTRALGDRGPPA